MVHALLIVVFVSIFLREETGEPALLELLGPGGAAGVYLVSLGAMWAAVHGMVWSLGRRVDKSGTVRAIRSADKLIFLLRVIAVMIHVMGVLVFGWLDVVRGVVGDIVLVDEVLAMSPVLVVFAAGWWSFYPIERRVREAVLLRDLDQGRPVQRMPTRGQYVMGGVRHQLALLLVPMLMIMTWAESLDRASPGFAARFGMSIKSESFALVLFGMELVGIVVVFSLTPLVMARIWDTVAMGPSPLRDELAAMCRVHRVKIRKLLIWRTHGGMVNGAVMGLFGPLRYILLTDGLLDGLSERQVHAVTAHEVGHVRCRHLPWLVLSLIVALGWTSVVIEWSMVRWGDIDPVNGWGAGVNTAVSLLAGLYLFGFVSRRFEWQADAFAVGHLSKLDENASAEDVIDGAVTRSAVEAMGGALEAVSQLNHVPREKSSWRHGSIAVRQKKLRGLLGLPVDKLWIDRQVFWMKVVIAIAGIVGIVLSVVAWQSGPGG